MQQDRDNIEKVDSGNWLTFIISRLWHAGLELIFEQLNQNYTLYKSLKFSILKVEY